MASIPKFKQFAKKNSRFFKWGIPVVFFNI
jgi:hypothetical protein